MSPSGRWSGLRGRDEDPDDRREGPPPASMAHVLEQLAGRKSWSRRLEGARIHEHWAAIAGESLAEHTEPVRLHGGVLVMRAESAAWATQVRYLTTELARRANEVLGDGQVERVQVITGTLQGPDQGPY